MEERKRGTIKATVGAMLVVAGLVAILVATEGPMSMGRQVGFSLVCTLVASGLTRRFSAGIAACATAVVMFTFVAPHIPDMGSSFMR